MSKPQAQSGSKPNAAGRAASRTQTGVSSKAKSKAQSAGLTAEERHRRIAEAAYYRAMRRGFHGGADLEDWLESEAEIDKLIWRG